VCDYKLEGASVIWKVKILEFWTLLCRRQVTQFHWYFLAYKDKAEEIINISLTAQV